MKTTLGSAGYNIKPNMDPSSLALNKDLKFVLAQYHINGTFLGYRDMTSELFLCPVTYSGVQNMLKFGTQTKKSCEFSIEKLKKGSASQDLPKTANIFYELYL